MPSLRSQLAGRGHFPTSDRRELSVGPGSVAVILDEDLWKAAGKSGPCAAAVVNAAAGFDSLTGNDHSLEPAMLKNDKSDATKAYGEIQTKTARLTAIISSFKTKCR